MDKKFDHANYSVAANSAKYLMPHWLERMLEDCENEDESWITPLVNIQMRSAVWNTCDLLTATVYGVAPQACRILQKYLVNGVQKRIAGMKNDEIANMQIWEEYKHITLEKLPLLIASCVQLAAKMVSAEVPLTAKRVRSKLIGEGIHFTLREVIMSEFEVFHSLGCRLPLWTSVEVGEALAHEAGCTSEAICLVAPVVEMAEYYRDEVQSRARWAAHLSPSGPSSLRTLHVCAGAVAASARISCASSEEIDTAETRLAEATKIPPLLLACLRDIIVELTLRNPRHSDYSEST